MTKSVLLLAALFVAMPVIAQTKATMSNPLKMCLKLKGYLDTNSPTMQTGGKEYRFAYFASFKTNGIAIGGGPMA